MKQQTGYKQFWKPAEIDFSKSPWSAPNGSLMRNAAIPALLYDQNENTLIENSLLHGIITHYGPAPVLTCVVQTLLISKAIQYYMSHSEPMTVAPTFSEIEDIIKGPWTNWKKTTKNPICKHWLESVSKSLEKAEQDFIQEISGFIDFNPYFYDYTDKAGWCILSLKIALWALHWSFQSSLPTCGVPPWLPIWIFKLKKFRSLVSVVAIGNDADTYGAISGALLAAYHPHDIPKNWVQSITSFGEICELFNVIGVAKNSKTKENQNNCLVM